ncbi:MAG: rhodanese-like domain-containing protein [Proteobacteria bacterium]|nr:rhodanese-like domain-containing protein [Pseudomonadota bacterium]
MRKIGFVAVLLVSVLLLAGCGQDAFKAEVPKDLEAVKLAREVVAGGYGLLNHTELKALVDSGEDMVIVDAMPLEDSYVKQHVPGAVQFLFPIGAMETWDTAETAGKTEAEYEALLGPDKNRRVVVYCGFVKCGRSHNAAIWAKKRGYINVQRFPGGIFAWKGAGYEVATGQ